MSTPIRLRIIANGEEKVSDGTMEAGMRGTAKFVGLFHSILVEVEVWDGVVTLRVNT